MATTREQREASVIVRYPWLADVRSRSPWTTAYIERGEDTRNAFAEEVRIAELLAQREAAAVERERERCLGIVRDVAEEMEGLDDDDFAEDALRDVALRIRRPVLSEGE